MLVKLLIGIYLILTKIVTKANQECLFEEFYNNKQISHTFKCTNTSSEDFLYDFLHVFKNMGHNNFKNYNVEITDSKFVDIYSFLPPVSHSSANLKGLSVINSSLEFIEDYAFEDLILMSVLILSNNKLKDMSFVKTLPLILEKLYLDGNDFETVSDVFGDLVQLKYLDLSRCKISNIDPNSFSKFRDFVFVNISRNRLTSFDVTFKNFITLEIDLSFNSIKSTNYTGKPIYFWSLNASHNKIKSMGDVVGSVHNDIKFIDISFNDLNNATFLTSSSVINIGNLNLANSNIDANFSLRVFGDVTVTGILDLSGNNLGILTPNIFGRNSRLTGLNLFNASINCIKENAFNLFHFYSHLDLDILNISSNPISVLKDYTFNNSWIRTIDVSKCLIQKIEGNAFFGLGQTNTLILNNNQISYLNKSTFLDLNKIEAIDLSFNSIKKLDNDLFINCRLLKFLKLSNSKIEVIRNRAFKGISNLKELDLRHNSLRNIGFQCSGILNVLNLENNEISNLAFSFFQNMSTSVLLLKHNKIMTLKDNTKTVRSYVREMDLSRSNIYTVEPGSFRGVTSLENLNLSNNFIDKIVAKTFAPLKRLIKLDLTGNRIVSFSSAAFMFGNQLNKLSITFITNNLQSKSFIALNYLKTLDIINSNITSLEENCFKGLLHLENFNLFNVIIKDITAGALNGLENLKDMTYSKIFFKNIETFKRGIFEGLPKLDLLDVSSLNIKSIEAKSFTGLSSLKRLSLSGNKLGNIVNNTFVGLRSLKVLNLSNNKIVQLASNAFLGLHNLVELSLCSNNITNISLGTFQSFPYLEELILCKNNISKLLTGTFTNLKYLKKLDLSYNNFSRLKMEHLFTLTNLQYLDLRGNHLIEIKHLELLRSLRHLKFVGLNNNRWRCNDLAAMLMDFQNHSINWFASKDITYTHENIDGISCVDVCNLFFCGEDYTWPTE